MGTSRYTNYGSVNWDIPIWSPDWKQVDSLLTNQEQGYQAAQQALNAPIDASSYGNDPLLREQIRLNRQQAENDLALTYKTKGVNAGNKALQGYLYQLQQDKNPGGTEYQLMQNKAAIKAYDDKINKAEGWSPEQKQLWLSMNLSNYKGSIQGSELKGFSGQDLSKFINDSLYAQKYLEKMKFHETEGFLINPEGKKITLDGSTAIYTDGQYFYRDKLKQQKLSSEEMILAAAPAMQQDPEFQSYIKDKMAIKLYGEAGMKEDNWKDVIKIQTSLIDQAVSKLDSLKTLDEKKSALKELTGNDYSKVDEQTIDSKIKLKRQELENNKTQSLSFNTYDSLLQYEANNDLLKTVSTNSKLYEVDNYSITSEHFLDEFKKIRLSFEADMAKKKAEEQITLPDYWMTHIRKINDEIVSGADEFDTYEKLSTGINKYYKELPLNVTTLNHEFKTNIANNPNSPLFKDLVASGFDPSKEDFVKLVYDEKTGNVSVDQTNLDKFGALSSAEGIGNTVQQYIDRMKEQANKITAGQSQLTLLIKKYQEYTGDKNITDNLKDVSENSFLAGNGKPVNEQVKYKQLYEKTVEKPKSSRDYAEKILDATFVIGSKKADIDKFFNEHYDDYVAYMKVKGKTPDSRQTLKEKISYNSNFTILSPITQLAWKEDEIFKDILAKKLEPEFKQLVSQDKSYLEKKQKFKEAMSELKKVQSSFETLYYISPINSTDSKVTKVINEKKKALANAIGTTVISKGTEAGILSDVETGAMITDTKLKDRIITALNSQKSYDDEGNLLPQKDNIDYQIGTKNGKTYAVMNVNFADEYKGKHSYSVQYEINEESPSLQKFLIEDEHLFQQNELLRTQEIAKQLKGNQVAITTYSLPDGQKFNINLSRKIRTAGDPDVSEYRARVVLPKPMQDRRGESSTFIEFNTNDISTPPRIVGILEKISTNANYFKTLKETRFPSDDEGFMKFITQDVVDMTNGKIGAYQATQLYDWLIKPIIDKGQILQQQPPQQSLLYGNFTNPQGFKW